MRSDTLASSMLGLVLLVVASCSYGACQNTGSVFDRTPACNCAPVINIGHPQTDGSSSDMCSNTSQWLVHVDNEVKVITTRADDFNVRLSTMESKVTLLQQGDHTHDGEDHAQEDFYNYMDEIAQSICTAVNTGAWTFAVRRNCATAGDRTCATICTDPQLKAQDSQVAAATHRMNCINSLHVYQNRPKWNSSEGFEKLGLKTYRYNSCINRGCGPNYCCCQST